jgi:hypothetical protein
MFKIFNNHGTFSTASAFVPMSPQVTRYKGFSAISATLTEVSGCRIVEIYEYHLSAVSVLPVPGPLEALIEKLLESIAAQDLPMQ